MKLFFGILLIALGVILLLGSFVFWWYLFVRKVDREAASTFVWFDSFPGSVKDALVLVALVVAGVCLIGVGGNLIG
ncbi:MAG: hypothetical protein QUS33_13890 [Dehalococcoidia bacterium]|nr:hypothetical protein [Dehalococcoidia bacterium]